MYLATVNSQAEPEMAGHLYRLVLGATFTVVWTPAPASHYSPRYRRPVSQEALRLRHPASRYALRSAGPGTLRSDAKVAMCGHTKKSRSQRSLYEAHT